ncbi:hypothetical protein [Bosea vaviloviae]|uniref:Uncharacterized protein n=1 Tax=Bosea vaviloviae TaxID=1526658 RepID=A0A0N0MB69_9HYPH|nr:hypothetical protein [Bosea vaviloviae]KPH80546.1 hypothetical protein AE618_12290 [Bosea vaviloviae]
MQPKPLSADLRELRDLMRKYVGAHQRPSVDACRELYVSLNVMAEKADELEACAAQAEELEAIARDLDMVASAQASPSLQEVLKRDQRSLQTLLDLEDLARGDRGLARLSAAIGNSNVFTFPMVPRPAISRQDVRSEDCQGEGGDAA